MSVQLRIADIYIITRKMVPICEKASSFLNLCQNNKHEKIQNQNANAFQHLSVTNQKTVDFFQCAGITHCLTAKVSNSLLKRKVLEVCVVSTIEF